MLLSIVFNILVLFQNLFHKNFCREVFVAGPTFSNSSQKCVSIRISNYLNYNLRTFFSKISEIIFFEIPIFLKIKLPNLNSMRLPFDSHHDYVPWVSPQKLQFLGRFLWRGLAEPIGAKAPDELIKNVLLRNIMQK